MTHHIAACSKAYALYMQRVKTYPKLTNPTNEEEKRLAMNQAHISEAAADAYNEHLCTCPTCIALSARVQDAAQAWEIAIRGKTPAQRYEMTQPQPAQIDCRLVSCRFHVGGSCTNIAPAITLNETDSFVCWSYEAKAVTP